MEARLKDFAENSRSAGAGRSLTAQFDCEGFVPARPIERTDVSQLGWVSGTISATVQMDFRPSKSHEIRQGTIFDPGC